MRSCYVSSTQRLKRDASKAATRLREEGYRVRLRRKPKPEGGSYYKAPFGSRHAFYEVLICGLKRKGRGGRKGNRRGRR